MSLLQWLYGAGSRWRSLRRLPAHINAPHGTLQPGSRPQTFVIACGPGFNQNVPNASTTARMGWCHGFEALGVPYLLVPTQTLAQVLPGLPDPMVWLSAADHAALDTPTLRALAQYRHAVQVDPAFNGAQRWCAQHGLPPLAMQPRAVDRVLASRPRFVFTIAAPSGFGFYAHWQRSGVPLLSLPLACDTAVYANTDAGADAGDTETETDALRSDIAFVGGYWRYKAQQFALYLEPYAARLSVYGYSPWPYGRYGGTLARHKEAALYRHARLSPVINEPHVPLMGIDLNERVFKVLGAGGLALTDATPAYRDWFSSEELLVPRTVAEYRAMADAVLAGEIDTRALRRRGQAAVLARHTYRHRALAFQAAMQGAAP